MSPLKDAYRRIFHGSYDMIYLMNPDDVFLLYDTCRFEKAWHPGSLSPWCAAFTDNEMRVIEYEEDLFFYYYASYGLEINKKLGCHNVQDMFDRFA